MLIHVINDYFSLLSIYSSYVDYSGIFLPFVLLDNHVQLYFDIRHQPLLIETKNKREKVLDFRLLNLACSWHLHLYIPYFSLYL